MKTNKTLRNVLSLVLALCLVFALASVTFAANANQAVLNDKSGVLRVNLVYTDAAGREYLVKAGSGFLVNETYLVTCYHVVTLTEEEAQAVIDHFGISDVELNQRLGVTISVLRDLTIKATVRHQTAELDYAILELSAPIYNRTTLPIRSSKDVDATEDCFALGFPGIQEYLQDVNTYTIEDVAVSAGKINKLVTVAGVDVFQSTAPTSAGNSGGPLVDSDGNVIGINDFVLTSGDTQVDANNFFAVASDQLITALDSLGIEYIKPGPQITTPPTDPVGINRNALNTAISNAKALVASDYTEESYKAVQDALSKAQAVADKSDDDLTQDEVDAAATALQSAYDSRKPLEDDDSVPEKNFPLWAIIAIAAAVVLAIVIAIILIASSNKKKKAPVAAPVRPAAPVPPVAPGAPAAGGFTPPAPAAPAAGFQKGNGPGTTVLNSGAGETTVLSAGGSETTVLSQNLGSLTRKKNHETIQISKPNFRIGKERSSVDYCISDNTAVSRVHVILVNRGGVMYAADQRSTNGTFVNDVRVDSGKEVRLKSGDKITLGDEEFVFNG